MVSARTSGKADKSSASWFIFQSVGWNLIVVLSCITALVVLGVLLTHDWSAEVGASRAILAFYPRLNNWALLSHIITAIPCLVLGPLLFIARIRS